VDPGLGNGYHLYPAAGKAFLYSWLLWICFSQAVLSWKASNRLDTEFLNWRHLEICSLPVGESHRCSTPIRGVTVSPPVTSVARLKTEEIKKTRSAGLVEGRC